MNSANETRRKPTCRSCRHCHPIGDPSRATYFCKEIVDGKVKIVLEDYGPGPYHFGCGGKKYEANL